ncbi:MAG: hypothetical protein CMH49_10350 [Myxococcales bacterium]|nr:hypothetical protein [Myxococcales bacterium]
MFINFYVPRIATLLAFTCIFIFVGCDVNLFDTPSHYISDDHSDYKINFSKDQLTGHYLTGTKVVFTIKRSDDEATEQNVLSIEANHPEIFKPFESYGSFLNDESKSVTKSFDVLESGYVDLSFKDGDEVILRRQIELIEASSLKLTREIPDILKSELNHLAGQGEKVLKDTEHTLRLTAKTRSLDGEQHVDIASLSDLPNLEGIKITQSNPFRMGLRLMITPQREGSVAVPLHVGHQDLDLDFTVVSETDISDLTVHQALSSEPGSEEENTLMTAIAMARDDHDEPIYGANIKWQRLKTNAMGEQIVTHTYTGNELSFIYNEDHRVPFRVRAGQFKKIIYLPVGIGSENPIVHVGDAFAGGCDTQQARLSHNLLIALIWMGILVLKRRAVV